MNKSRIPVPGLPMEKSDQSVDLSKLYTEPIKDDSGKYSR